MKSISTLTTLALIVGMAPALAQVPGAYGYPGGYPGQSGYFQSNAQAFDIRTNQDQQGYYLIVTIRGISPDQVAINSYGNMVSVEINNNTSRRVTQATPGGEQGGVHGFRSYSYSSSQSSMSRRLPLPADADTSKAVRKNADGQVTVFIPRRVR